MARYTPSLYPRERRYNPFIREQKLTVLGLSLHGGRILSALELPWFTLLPPRGFGVLTTIGRKTGRQRRKCVRVARRGDRVYIVSIGGPDMLWLKNIQANPHVSLRIRGGTFAGRARTLTDPLESDHARDAYCESAHAVDYMACLNWRKGRPTRARIKDLTRGWFEEGVPLVVELDPGSGRAGA
ncbi:MAG TPA: nitroreductase family deazaflavin-dependent oxidoreductase [Solirubrobacteraceae bacterium]|jgi:deazaflavin-dependent oxidoreductase (nitroreductase family)|nr:nitroreductase family deazaflavin-dependent oxidoreductase [Solirubrobacteraceae bacterium]